MSKYKSKYQVFTTSFGKALKEEVDSIGPSVLAERYNIALAPADFNDPYCKTEFGKQPKILQAHGKARRAENPFYWVRFVDQYAKQLPRNCILLVSDLRNTPETLWLEQEGGYSVNVVREGYIDPNRNPNHDSEISLDNYDYDYRIIVPEGRIDISEARADEVFNDIIERQSPVRDEFIAI